MREWRGAARGALALVAGTLALAGCGAQSPRSTARPEPRVHAPRESSSAQPPARHRAAKSWGREARAASPAASNRRRIRYAEGLGAGTRARLVSHAAASFLLAHRLVDATFRVSRDGYALDVAIPAADVCTTAGRVAGDAAFVKDLRDTVGFLRTVTVHVAGRAGGLRRYLGRHCRRLSRVYRRSGSGSFTSPLLEIPGGRAIVLLAAPRGPAQVEALGIAPSRTFGTLTLTEPGVTTRTFTAVGRIRLRVHGLGKWTVAVLRPAL
jgi:hypothetical protein